ncbi:MAG: SCO family protein [Kofleriaceae bacterium]
MRTNTALIVVALTALGAHANAHPDGTAASTNPSASNPVPDDRVLTAQTWKGDGVTVNEKLGAQIPLDARFRTADGAHVALSDLVKGELPVILTFNYSDCPMLCSLQLNGLSKALPLVGEKFDNKYLRVGSQFRIVTIDLEPNEPIEKIQKMRDKYLARLPEDQREQAKAGWTFLVAETQGDPAQIKRVADAVGFSYMYIKERAEWAHPAALIFLASSGVVTRYVYGIDFDTQVMRESITKAGTHESATAVGFMNRCYHYDPDANSHAHAGVLALRLAAASAIVALLSGVGLAVFLRKHRRPHEVSET